jgi:hypothetical protein
MSVGPFACSCCTAPALSLGPGNLGLKPSAYQSGSGGTSTYVRSRNGRGSWPTIAYYKRCHLTYSCAAAMGRDGQRLRERDVKSTRDPCPAVASISVATGPICPVVASCGTRSRACASGEDLVPRDSNGPHLQRVPLATLYLAERCLWCRHQCCRSAAPESTRL